MKQSIAEIPPMEVRSERRRTLIFSQRNLVKILPYRCAHFEFEDVISKVDSVDILAPQFDSSTLRQIFTKRLAYHTPLTLSPRSEQASIQNDYDLFLAICGNPTDLLRLNAIKGWRKKCRRSICLIDEIWITEINSYRYFLNMLDDFDVVVLYYSQSVKPISKRIGERCIFLPPGVDTVRFSPHPNPPARGIDIYSIGRRSAITHQAFLEMAAKDGLFYLHDSTSADRVLDAREHRILFSNILKRSKYFIVNPGLIDRPDIRGAQIEIGNRYFEGAASGSILVGERPHTKEFEDLFDWRDALIDLPYDSPDVGKVLRELDEQPERTSAIQKMNIQQTLLRHDWCYRWEAILKAVGIVPLPQLDTRKRFLEDLAGQIILGETLRADPSPDLGRTVMASPPS